MLSSCGLTIYKNGEIQTRRGRIRSGVSPHLSSLIVVLLTLGTLGLLALLVILTGPDLPLVAHAGSGERETERLATACNVAGFIDTDTTWSPSFCDPYIVTGNLVVNSGVSLTIQAGTTVKFDSLKALSVQGTLIATGTATTPVTFTSNQASPAPGAWGYIHFADTSTDATFDGSGNYMGGSIIQYAIIEYAGGVSPEYGAVNIDKSSPFIDHNTIRYNDTHGIRVFGRASPVISNNNILDNSAIHGIYGDEISGGGIIVEYNRWFTTDSTTITGNTISGNSAAFRGGGIFIYDAHYANISNNTITCISAGAGGGIYLSMGGGQNDRSVISGNTISSNTASRPIRVTNYGGGLVIDGNFPDLTVSNNTIAGNSTAGIGGGMYLYDIDPAAIITNTIAYNTAGEVNGGGGILYAGSGGSWVAVNNNDIYDNLSANDPNGLAIVLDSAAGYGDLNAESNYWGTSDSGVIEDLIWHFVDDASLGVVDYFPYRTTPVHSTPPAWWDFDGSGVVDVADIARVAADWRATEVASLARYDFNGNDVVDVGDIQTVVAGWGDICP